MTGGASPASTPPGSVRQPGLNFQPAIWMAGRRRRYAARHERAGAGVGALPRSATTPVLYSGVGLAGGMAVSPAYVAYTQPEAAPPTRTKSTSDSISPASTIDARDAVTEGRTEGRTTRNILEVMKRKEGSLPRDPVVTSPLPLKPLTPKAARVLGLPLSEGIDDPTERKSADSIDSADEDEDVQAPPMMHKKSSLQWLNSQKLATERQSKLREENLDEFGMPVTAPTQGFLKKIEWKGSGKKAKQMLDLMQPKAMRSNQDLVPDTPSRSGHEGLHDNDVGYSSDSDMIAPRRIAPRLNPAQKQRSGIRKKAPKSLDRLSPITEASLSEDGFVVAGDRDSAVLEAISEDEPPSYTLAGDDLSTDEDELSQSERKGTDSEEDLDDEVPAAGSLQPATAGLRSVEHPETIKVKSALQELENMYLDNMEMKKTMDIETEQLYDEHVSMSRELSDIKARSLFQDVPSHKSFYGHVKDDIHHPDPKENYDGHICGDIEDIPSDEEPEILKASYTTFTRITPGMVKLVDIPHRKSKATGNQDVKSSNQAKLPVSHRRGGVVLMGNVSARELLKPFKDTDIKRPKVTFARSSLDRFEEPMKAPLFTNESRGQPQGWVDDYDYAGMPSLPKRNDTKVLAEQEKPPTPLPKDTPSLSPLQTRSLDTPRPKHQCVHNGHIFHKYSLSHTPNNIGINDLEVRPYFQTPIGIKQDIDIPIRCQKCSFSVIDELWQCSVPVCRLAVCKHCAVEMEMEWQERAVEGWKRK